MFALSQICQFIWKAAMRHKCSSLLLPLFLVPLLMGDLAMALRHYNLEEGYTKTIPRPNPLNITASWNLRFVLCFILHGLFADILKCQEHHEH